MRSEICPSRPQGQIIPEAFPARMIFRSLIFLLGVMWVTLMLSVVALAIPIAFQKEDDQINPWFFSAGLFAAAVFAGAAGYATKKMFFSPIQKQARLLPAGVAIFSYLIVNSIVFNLVPREVTQGHALLDFSKVAAPWILAWLGYRVTKRYVQRCFSNRSASHGELMNQ